MDTATADKIARNNAAFREANEQIATTAVEHDLEDDLLPFLCECSDRRCTTVIHLTLDEYRHVRSHPRWFAHAVDHEVEVEGAVEPLEQNGRYALVQKVGRAGAATLRLDRRSPA